MSNCQQLSEQFSACLWRGLVEASKNNDDLKNELHVHGVVNVMVGINYKTLLNEQFQQDPKFFWYQIYKGEGGIRDQSLRFNLSPSQMENIDKNLSKYRDTYLDTCYRPKLDLGKLLQGFVLNDY